MGCFQIAQEIEDGEIISIAVHPNGDQIMCATTSGDCKYIVSISLAFLFILLVNKKFEFSL